MNDEMFPKIIKNLPIADIPIEGLDSYIFQGDNQQILFMEFENNVEVSEHSHEAQWGVVLAGEIEFKIEGKKFEKRRHIFYSKWSHAQCQDKCRI